MPHPAPAARARQRCGLALAVLRHAMARAELMVCLHVGDMEASEAMNDILAEVKARHTSPAPTPDPACSRWPLTRATRPTSAMPSSTRLSAASWKSRLRYACAVPLPVRPGDDGCLVGSARAGHQQPWPLPPQQRSQHPVTLIPPLSLPLSLPLGRLQSLLELHACRHVPYSVSSLPSVPHPFARPV